MSKSSAYTIVPYASDFDSQIVQLQTYLWSPDSAGNAAYLRWKYADNPFLDETLVQLALCDGRVVAMRGMFGSLWQVDDAAGRHVLPHADDFVIAPEHRNRGLASRIMKAALDDAARRGFPFAVSLSAGAVTFLGSLAAGWRSPGSYQSIWRRRTTTSLVGRLRNRARRTRWGARLSPAPFARLDREAKRSPGRVSLSREPRPRAMADLIERLPWDGRIRHVRDAAYFAWRFRNPLYEYRFLFRDDGALQGYLVLQRQRRDPDPGYVNIVDWEATTEGVRAELLETALRWGEFSAVHGWGVGMSEPVSTLVRDHGFEAPQSGDLPARSEGLLVHRLGDTTAERWMLGSRNVLNLANWDLRMLYSMAG